MDYQTQNTKKQIINQATNYNILVQALHGLNSRGRGTKWHIKHLATWLLYQTNRILTKIDTPTVESINYVVIVESITLDRRAEVLIYDTENVFLIIIKT